MVSSDACGAETRRLWSHGGTEWFSRLRSLRLWYNTNSSGRICHCKMETVYIQTILKRVQAQACDWLASVRTALTLRLKRLPEDIKQIYAVIARGAETVNGLCPVGGLADLLLERHLRDEGRRLLSALFSSFLADLCCHHSFPFFSKRIHSRSKLLPGRNKSRKVC